MRWSDRAAAAVVLVLALPGAALAASPTPDAVGDPRSSGQGPGLVGDPLMAIVIVIAIAVLALVVTVAYVRVTAGRQERRTP
jgi:hypothetical protein